MKLVVDTVYSTSPGGRQTQAELARAVRSCMPSGWDVLFLTPADNGGPERHPHFAAEPVPRPRGWISMWEWFNVSLPDLARRSEADVVYSLTGIVTPAMKRSFATVSSIINVLPFYQEHYANYSPFSKERMLFAGPPADPAYLELMEQAIAAGGLQHRVRYLGFVDRQTIPGWLGHARA